MTSQMEQNKHIEALLDISLTLAQSLTLSELMDGVLARILEAMEIKVGGIFLLDQKTNGLVLRTQRGMSAEFVRQIESIKADKGSLCEVALSGKALLVKDVGREPEFVHIGLAMDGLRSFAAVPMMVKGQIIGVMCVASYGAREFVEQEMRLLIIIANQVAMAIGNAQLYERTTENSNVDKLTGLYSKQYMKAEIDRMFAYASRSGHKLISMIKIDVDRLKEINDSLGRQAGDALLKEFLRIIRQQIRGYDIAARWGGDVFMLLIPDTNSEDALKIGKRIIAEVKKYSPVINNVEMVVSISMGIASYPTHAYDAAELLKAVDNALINAKRVGGDRAFLAPPLASSGDGTSVSTGTFRAF